MPAEEVNFEAIHDDLKGGKDAEADAASAPKPKKGASTHREVRLGQDPTTGLGHRWQAGEQGPADHNAMWGKEDDIPTGCFGSRPGGAKSEAKITDAKAMFVEPRRDISHGTNNRKFTNAEYGAAEWHPFKQERGCMAGMFCDAPRKATGDEGQSSDAKQFLAHIKGDSEPKPVKPAFSRGQGTKYRGEGEVAPHRAIVAKQSFFSCFGTKDPKMPDQNTLEEAPEPKTEAAPEGYPTPENDHIATLKENLDSWHMDKFDEVYGVGACYNHLPKELQPAYLATPALQAHCATFPAPDADHISILKATPDDFHMLKFDEVYGPGAAAKQLAQ